MRTNSYYPLSFPLPAPYEGWDVQVDRNFYKDDEHLVRITHGYGVWNGIWNGSRIRTRLSRPPRDLESLMEMDRIAILAAEIVLPPVEVCRKRLLTVGYSEDEYICDVGEYEGEMWCMDVRKHLRPPGIYEGNDHWINVCVWSAHANTKYRLGWNGRRLAGDQSALKLASRPKLLEAVLKLLKELYPPQDLDTTAADNPTLWAEAEGFISKF